MTLLDAAGAAIDFTTSGGWGGQLHLLKGLSTGASGSEVQVALCTPASSGQMHLWYVNVLATDGGFYNSATFTTVNLAAESYTSGGGFNVNPNQFAPPTIDGVSGSGSVFLIRKKDDSNGSGIVRVNRGAAGSSQTATVMNSVAAGTTTGDTFSVQLFQLFKAFSTRVTLPTHTARVDALVIPTLSKTQLDLSATLPGYGAPLGVQPVGYYQTLGMFVPFYNATTNRGAVAAIEYAPTQDGGITYDLFTSGYTFESNKFQYDDDTGTAGAPSDGSFNEGIAPVLGAPTALAWAPLPATNTIVYCATDAGLLYAWEAHGLLASTNTQRKGMLMPCFPLRIDGGRITSIAFLRITNTTVLAQLGLSGTTNCLGCFTDSGQVVLVRTPAEP
jgi:hypothetical protein